MSPTHSIAAESATSLKKQRAPKEDIDFALDQIDMYRMRVPCDGNSLLRCMALQLYNTQIFFTKMRAALVRYLARHRDQYERRVLSQQATASGITTYELYLEHVSRDGVECGPTEISALSALYQCSIYQHECIQAARPRPLTADRSYRNSIFLYCTSSPNGAAGEQHFDLVLPKVKLSIAGMCQGITYNILYSRVYQLGPAVDTFVHLMLNNSVDSTMNSPLEAPLAEKLGITTDMPVGLLTPSFGGHAVPDGLSHSSPRGQIIDDIRTVLQELGPPFPYKVAKSIATFVYRNPDQDVYDEKTKEKHRNKRRSDAGLVRESSSGSYNNNQHGSGGGQFVRDYGYSSRQGNNNYQQRQAEARATGYGSPFPARPYYKNAPFTSPPNMHNDMPLSPGFPPPMLLSPPNFNGVNRATNMPAQYNQSIYGGFRLMPPPAAAQQYNVQQQQYALHPNYGAVPSAAAAACYSPLPAIPPLPQPTRFNTNDSSSFGFNGNNLTSANPASAVPVFNNSSNNSADAATMAAVNAATAGAWLEAFNPQRTPFLPPPPIVQQQQSMNAKPQHFQYNNSAIAASAGSGGNGGGRYYQQAFFSSPIPVANQFPLSPTPGTSFPFQSGARVPSAQRAPPPLANFFNGPGPMSPFFSVTSPAYAAAVPPWSPMANFGAVQPPPLPSAQQLLSQRFFGPNTAGPSNFGFSSLGTNNLMMNDGDFGSPSGLWKPPTTAAPVPHHNLHRGYKSASFQYGNRGSPLFNQSSAPLFETNRSKLASNHHDPAVLRANFASPSTKTTSTSANKSSENSGEATTSPSSGLASSFAEDNSSPDSPHSSSAATDEFIMGGERRASEVGNVNDGGSGSGKNNLKQGSPSSPAGSMRSSSAQAQPNKKRSSEMSESSVCSDVGSLQKNDDSGLICGNNDSSRDAVGNGNEILDMVE